MNNAELIKALRLCADDEGDCDGCAYYMQGCMLKMWRAAADALEATERLLDQNVKRCEALRKQLREANESYEKHINELEAQLPKEAHWVAVDNGHGVCSNCNRQDSIDNMATHCRYCGARMRGANDEN